MDLEHLVDAVYAAVLADFGTTTGKCYAAYTAVCAVLDRAGVPYIGRRGDYCTAEGQFNHLWVEAGGLRLDPTRSQFDQGPRTTPLHEGQACYVILTSYPPMPLNIPSLRLALTPALLQVALAHQIVTTL